MVSRWLARCDDNIESAPGLAAQLVGRGALGLMLQEEANKRRGKRCPWLGAAFLLAALLAVYANHFHNSFHFDDAHTVVNNAAIQSMKNVPRFFTDARTFMVPFFLS